MDRVPPARSASRGGQGHPEHGEGHDPEELSVLRVPASRSVGADVSRRLRALIDEVVEQLMQEPHADPRICRSDAIALLMASALDPGAAPQAPESPLIYLLRQEQQSALACLDRHGRRAEFLIRA